jgi:hypothetical protein
MLAACAATDLPRCRPRLLVPCRHQLVKREASGGFRLIPVIKEMTEDEVHELVRLCDDAITNYSGRRGRKLYDHRRIALGDLSAEGF